jgi:hypothetical protein
MELDRTSSKTFIQLYHDIDFILEPTMKKGRGAGLRALSKEKDIEKDYNRIKAIVNRNLRWILYISWKPFSYLELWL